MTKPVGRSQGSEQPTLLYFGCWGSSKGHWLRDVQGTSLRFDHKVGRWPIINSAKIDGAFAPKSDRSHGAAKLWHSAGWTILALHDYSRDDRPGSNAAFLLRGHHTAEEVLAAARKPFGPQLDHIEGMGPIRVVEEHRGGASGEAQTPLPASVSAEDQPTTGTVG